MKNKKGFTLIELLAVIVLLGLIAAISYPKVLEVYNSKQKDVKERQQDIIKAAAEEYVNDNINNFPTKSTTAIKCILVSELANYGDIKEYTDYYVKVSINSSDRTYQFYVSKDCTASE